MGDIDGERAAVQNRLVRYAVEAGWTFLPPDEALRLRRGEGGLALNDIAADHLQRLNPGVVDLNRSLDILRRLSVVRPNIEGNLEMWEHLKGLRAVFLPEEKRERNIRLLDPDHPDRWAPSELALGGGSELLRPACVEAPSDG